jgi:hypothetical protein
MSPAPTLTALEFIAKTRADFMRDAERGTTHRIGGNAFDVLVEDVLARPVNLCVTGTTQAPPCRFGFGRARPCRW